MKKLPHIPLLFVLTVSVVFYTNAQTITFQKMYGTPLAEYLFDLTEFSTGGYIATGVQYKSTLNGDIYLIRTDINGTQLWAKTFGDTLFQQALGVREGEGGDIFVAGTTRSAITATNEVFVLKTDSMGTLKWMKRYSEGGYDQCNVMEKIPGGFVIGGTAGGDDAFLLKIDTAGTVLWNKIYNSNPNTEILETVKPLPDGSLLFDGYSITSAPSGTNAYLAKTDSSGNLLWWHFYSNGVSEIHDLGIFDDGSVIMGGEGGNFQMLLFKADTAGNLQWTKAFGLGVVDLFFSTKILADGNVLLAGHSFISGAPNLGYDMALIKCDTSGNFIWTRNIGGYFNDQCYAVTVCNDGGYALCGMTDNNSSSGGFPGIARLVKTDTLGLSGCNETTRSYTSVNITLNDSLGNAVQSSVFTSSFVNPPSGLAGTDSTLCITTGIQNEMYTGEKISCYPNPVEDVLYVEYIANNKNAELEMYNTFGKKVYASQLTQQGINSVNVSKLSPGIYFVKIMNGEPLFSNKIIKL